MIAPGKSVLIVEDEAQIRKFLRISLEAHGYEVVSATEGEAALELAVSAEPDLVLLDVLMPQPDGYTVCRRLREQAETAVCR